MKLQEATQVARERVAQTGEVHYITTTMVNPWRRVISHDVIDKATRERRIGVAAKDGNARYLVNLDGKLRAI